MILLTSCVGFHPALSPYLSRLPVGLHLALSIPLPSQVGEGRRALAALVEVRYSAPECSSLALHTNNAAYQSCFEKRTAAYSAARSSRILF